MTKRFRVFAIVLFMLIAFTGTASALENIEDANFKTVRLSDNGNYVLYSTPAETVEEFFEERDITLHEYDEVDKSLSYHLQEGDTVKIDRSFSIVLNLDGVPRMVTTTKKTVGELFDSLDEFSPSDYILENVEEDSSLSNNMTINLLSTIEKITKKTEEISFETITRDNPDLEYGIEKVVQEGSVGQLEITTKEIYQGSKLISVEEIDRQITKEPIDTIIENGTKKKVTTPTGNFQYQKALNVTATGYTPYDPGCNGVTASGTPAKFGVIAVDPGVIPIGTNVYIPGYGLGVAEDTGGAIKGNRIDLCYETTNEAYRWGRRNITIYILE